MPCNLPTCVNYPSSNLCQQKIAGGWMRSVIIKKILYTDEAQATRVNGHSWLCEPSFPPQCLSYSAREWLHVLRASVQRSTRKILCFWFSIQFALNLGAPEDRKRKNTAPVRTHKTSESGIDYITSFSVRILSLPKSSVFKKPKQETTNFGCFKSS